MFSDIEGDSSAFGGAQFNGEYQNNIDANPLICDLANLNFHLQDCSPCIDAGETGVDIGVFDGDYCTCLTGIPSGSYGTGRIVICPQPVTGFCEIKYSITGSGKTRIEILDLQGRTIMTLRDSYMPAGIYSEQADLSMLPAGLYFCRITSGDQQGVARIVRHCN
jgi:hypothetical protein